MTRLRQALDQRIDSAEHGNRTSKDSTLATDTNHPGEEHQVQGSSSKRGRPSPPTTTISYQRGSAVRPVGMLSNVSLIGKLAASTWDIQLDEGHIKTVKPHDASRPHSAVTKTINGDSALLVPSLCHPHVHLDKAFLLAHPKYADLRVEKGTFEEAMELTNKAKSQFSETDLLERGLRLIDESVAAGVTHLRAFVEIDQIVDRLCLDAGLKLKKQAEDQHRCRIQICAYAQLPIFTAGEEFKYGTGIKALMDTAVKLDEVEVIGSTPYVEQDRSRTELNIEWMITLAISHNKHLDFHLDYNLDPKEEPTVWHVIKELKKQGWSVRNKDRTVVLGHCTRLTLFDDSEWQRLREEIGTLPISFVGLPTSDLYMMRTKDETRGTLNVPRMIKEHGLNACIGINNIGNAFTPQGSCDPMTLACNGVGIYQAGTEQDAELLFECISTRARRAVGMAEEDVDSRVKDTSLQAGDMASMLLFGADPAHPWRTRHKISEAVYLYDAGSDRQVFFEGRAVS